MLILQNVKTLYDGSSADKEAIHEGVDVFIDKGKIQQILPHDAELSIGDSHQAVDASRYTVTPGLVDCHGHITVLGLTKDSEGVLEKIKAIPGVTLVETQTITNMVI